MGQIKVERDLDGIKGLCLIIPTVHGDGRGYFVETYNQEEVEAEGFNISFVQDNHSMSVKGVLCGLHFQKQHSQTKWVRVIKGGGIRCNCGSAERKYYIWSLAWRTVDCRKP